MSIFKLISDEDLHQIKNLVKQSFEELKDINVPRIRGTFKIGDEIIDAYRNGYKNVIVEAPTGFGKTFLGFYITEVAKNINLHLLKDDPDVEQDRINTSYLLTPNKFLQEQYEQDIKFYNFRNINMLKGQSNYICNKDAVNFNDRPCEGEKFNDLVTGKTSFTCGSICTFLNLRKKAIESHSTVLNYSYWLSAMNYVFNRIGSNAPFIPRGLTVFDEAHVLGKTVQDMFSVDLNINSIINQGVNQKVNLELLTHEKIHYDVWTFRDLMNSQINLINEYDLHKDFQMSNFETVYEKLKLVHEELEKIKTLFTPYFAQIVNRVKSRNAGIKNSDIIKKATQDEKYFLNYYKDINTKCEEFDEILKTYNHLGKPSMVLNLEKNNFKFNKTIPEFGEVSNYSIKLQCANESGLVESKVTCFTENGLYMSATFGKINEWAEQTGIKDYYSIIIPQIFNYDKSPIIKVTPMISMNYNNKHENLPILVSRIMKLIDKHPNERGLIHTGTFEIMQMIEKQGNRRILTYNNSAEKEDIINLLHSSPNAIVAGPSLIEGVDLKGDLARFQIMAKVPYLSLADELVKRKMKIYENWYNWITMTSIKQGLGRTIRFEGDWSITYLLDAGFESFFERYKPDQYILDRLIEKDIFDIGN